jgi:hypothetical protein
LKFDAEGNKQIVAALKSSDKKDHLRVDVTGDIERRHPESHFRRAAVRTAASARRTCLDNWDGLICSGAMWRPHKPVAPESQHVQTRKA